MLLKEVYTRLDAAVKHLAATDALLGERLDAALAEVALLDAHDFPPGDLRSDFNQLVDLAVTYRERSQPTDLREHLALAILDQYKHLIASTGITHQERTIFGSIIHHDS